MHLGKPVIKPTKALNSLFTAGLIPSAQCFPVPSERRGSPASPPAQDGLLSCRLLVLGIWRQQISNASASNKVTAALAGTPTLERLDNVCGFHTHHSPIENASLSSGCTASMQEQEKETAWATSPHTPAWEQLSFSEWHIYFDSISYTSVYVHNALKAQSI